MLNLIFIAMAELTRADGSTWKAQHILCFQPCNFLVWFIASSPTQTHSSCPETRSCLLQVSPSEVAAEISMLGKSCWAFFSYAAMNKPPTLGPLMAEQPNPGAASQKVKIQKTG